MFSQQFRNKYEILSKISQGGMGTIFKIKNRKTGDILAAKIPLADDPSFAKNEDKLNKEIVALGKNNSPRYYANGWLIFWWWM